MIMSSIQIARSYKKQNPSIRIFILELIRNPTLRKKVCQFFADGNTLILTEQEQKQCEGFLSASECLESLKSMESNKSPGSDGLPAEFYKVFWNDINQHLLNALNCAYTKGLLASPYQTKHYF